MRAFSLILLILTGALTAAAQLVTGPETLLGDATLAPIATQSSTVSTPVLASDGDEILMVWTGRSSLYAQRLDRHGRLVTELPKLLVSGAPDSGQVSGARVVYTGGLYAIFYSRLNAERRFETWVLRVTRELEIVDQRVFTPSDSVYDIVRDGDELLLLMRNSVWRVRDDLSVIGTVAIPYTASRSIAPSPHGTLLVSGAAPAITVRMLDESVTARLVSADSVGGLRAMWTGTQFLVVWSRCFQSSCATSLVTLDEQLRPIVGPVPLETGGCNGCGVGITLLGTDDALVTWSGVDKIRGLRVRKGRPEERTPWNFGTTNTFLTAQGLLLTVSALSVRAFVPDALSQDPATLPVVAVPQGAGEERIIAVGRSAGEVAVVRRRPDGANVASILDHDGRVLREAGVPSGEPVALGHDGRDFYALVSNQFQKLEQSAVAVRLPFAPASALVWAGSGFVILQQDYADHTGRTQYRTRMLWLTREGVVELPPCPNWEFPSGGPASVVEAGGDTVIAVGKHLARIRDGCPAGPSTPAPDLPYDWRPAWQNGMWAWVTTPEGWNADLSLTDDPARPASVRRIAEKTPVYESSVHIAPLSGHWLVAYNARNLYAMLLDGDGGVLSTTKIADATDGRPYLVPLSPGRVLAVYQRQVMEPPYLGATRVLAAPLTLAPSRRRVVRP